MNLQPEEEFTGPVRRLTQDIKKAAVTLSLAEVRFLVDAYYTMQKDRIRSAHQERQLEKEDEPHSVLSWLATQSKTLEGQLERALDAYSASSVEGRWARSIVGIGPIIAAGLLAHVDVEGRPTAGHLWSFAGLNPTREWGKSEKRPWNADLKRLCWIIGESFVKVSANENDVYGKIYKARKVLEIERNEAGLFVEQAAAALTKKKFGKDTEAKKHYLAGRLPPAHIHARAKRYAVKLFLSHLHAVMWWVKTGNAPPKPFILTQDGHVHFIMPPNVELLPGLQEALQRAMS